MEELYPSQAILTEKLETFKAKFTEYFEQKLKITAYQAENLMPAKTGKKSGLVSGGIEWTREIISVVPVAGDLVSLGLKIPQQIIAQKAESHQQHKVERISEAVQGGYYIYIKNIIEEVSRELSRIYEAQIALLADEGNIKKFAHAAVDMALSYFSKSKNEGIAFDRNNLLKAIVEGGKSYTLEGEDKVLHTTQGEKWVIPSVFTKTGIRQKSDDSYTFDFYAPPGSRPEKYGYRAEILFYEVDKGKYSEFSEIDNCKEKNKNKIPDRNEQVHRDYAKHSIFIVVKSSEIRAYEDYLANLNKCLSPQSFNAFIAERYGRPQEKVKSVYRGDRLQRQRDLSQTDFSETNFSGIHIENLTAKAANFDRCHFNGATFKNVSLEKAQLKKTQFTAAKFEANTSLKETNISHADFSLAQAEETMDFSNILNDKGATFECSNFDTIKNSEINLNELVKPSEKTENKAKAMFTIRTATANVPGSRAVRALDDEDYKPLHEAEKSHIDKNLDAGHDVHVGGSVANAPGANAYLFGKTVDPSVADLVKFSMLHENREPIEPPLKPNNSPSQHNPPSRQQEGNTRPKQ